MEKRKTASPPPRSTPLPADYLKMVGDVFAANFDDGLKRFREIATTKANEANAKHEPRSKDAYFAAAGEVFPDEILLCVALVQGDQLSATSVYASVDFDPKASSPGLHDLLATCVDAIGAVYQELFDSKDEDAIERIASASLSALEDAPFHWTPVTVEKRKIHVKLDKANPTLEKLADEWLRRNDPDLGQLEAENEEAAKKLFVTGPGGPTQPGTATKTGGKKTRH